MRKKLILLLNVGLASSFAVVFSATAFADVKQDVAVLMEHDRNFEEEDDTAIRQAPPLEVISELDKYRNDPDERVQSSAVSYTLGTAVLSGKLPVLQAAVISILDTAAREPSNAVTRNATQRLLIFPRAAFAEKARQTVHKMFMAKEPDASVLLLIGIVEDQSAKIRLQELGKEMVATELDPKAGRWWGTRPWAAHLALARLGDAAEIKFCIDAVEAEKNDVIRVSRLLKDLDYIRQPATVKVLIRYLLSDGAIPESFPDVPRAPYANYALNRLSESIEDFPQWKKNDGAGDWLARARAWVKTHQNDLKIKR